MSRPQAFESQGGDARGPNMAQVEAKGARASLLVSGTCCADASILQLGSSLARLYQEWLLLFRFADGPG